VRQIRNFRLRRRFTDLYGPSRLVLLRVEASALNYAARAPAGLRGPTPLLRLQGDDRLVALTRRGNQAAYEALVARYQARLLAFCRHMLGSREDAEDVLQEVFAAAFNAMLADDRPINVRPWLYRIARNRCLNHLRRQTAIGVDSMDVHLAENGTTTADKVHDREEFRELVADVHTLPETQRTALLLREIDALSYEQIAEAMDTTVPSVKSLLVRARVSLAEAAEARKLTCEEVREELGAWAEGLARIGAPARRHVRGCQRCSSFKKQLRQTNRALAAVFPVGPLLLLKKFLLAQGAGGAAASGAAATGSATVGGATAGSALTAGVGAVAGKTAAGLAAVAIVTTGAVEVDQVQRHRLARHAVPAQAVAAVSRPAPPPAPVVVRSVPQPAPKAPPAGRRGKLHAAGGAVVVAPAPADAATSAAPASTATPATPGAQEGYDVTALPAQPDGAAHGQTPPAPASTAAPAPADPPQDAHAGEQQAAPAGEAPPAPAEQPQVPQAPPAALREQQPPSSAAPASLLP
jgi:RNA polymerase sigma factor (sigma-70 family)